MTLFVVGNLTEDMVFALPRLPAVGETLIAKDRIVDIGGKGLNQALIAGRGGMETRLIAPVGRDEVANKARRLLAVEPIDAVLVETERTTDQSIIAVGVDGDNHIISTAFAADALVERDVVEAARDAVSGDHLLMQGNLSFETTHRVLEWARLKGLGTTLNPSPIRWCYDRLWPLIDGLILNEPELVALSGEDDLIRGAKTLVAQGVRNVLVTRGAAGAIMISREGRIAVAAASANVVDTAGAGDTFCGVFLAALDRGHDDRTAMSVAARAAAITIGRRGTWSAFPDKAELADILRTAGSDGVA